MTAVGVFAWGGDPADGRSEDMSEQSTKIYLTAFPTGGGSGAVHIPAGWLRSISTGGDTSNKSKPLTPRAPPHRGRASRWP